MTNSNETTTNSSSDFQDQGTESSPDETFKNSEEEEKSRANSLKDKTTFGQDNHDGSQIYGVFPRGSGTNSNTSAPQRENLLRKRIMQLPLSPLVKSFLLYYRDI